MKSRVIIEGDRISLELDAESQFEQDVIGMLSEKVPLTGVVASHCSKGEFMSDLAYGAFRKETMTIILTPATQQTKKEP